MRTHRLLQIGCGLLALSLLAALGLSNLQLTSPDPAGLAAVSLVHWVREAALLAGVLLVVAHVVAQALAPPSVEEQFRDWYEDS